MSLFNPQIQAGPRAIPTQRRPTNSEDERKGYGCAVYQDYLLLLGTTREETELRGGSILCVYNLKEQRAEEIEGENVQVSIGPCTHCFYPKLSDGVIFYGKIEAGGARGMAQECMTVLIKKRQAPLFQGSFPINNTIDRLDFTSQTTIPGPGSALSVCSAPEDILYVYDPNPENANFGSLKMYAINGAFSGWQDFQANTNDIRLNEPSRHALFINNVLYIFAGNVDFPSQTRGAGSSIIEDIYALDLTKNQKSGTWGRISPSGAVPGVMTNVLLAETNGMVYVFGLSEGKSVLWVYSIGEKEWKQVKDINTLTSRPDQKAVIYEGQLLIIDWGYSRDSVQIQYLKLNNLNFASPSVNEKTTMCKDQSENFFEDARTLYNTKIFSDVIFEIEGEEIPAHKATLASRSDYFMKMFTSGMSESHSAKISIPNMKSHVFKALLQYIYCNEVELHEKLALDLIPTVDEYVMKGLKGLCEKYLCKQLRKDNVVDMLIVADRHEITDLKKVCFKFILQNLDNIDENEEINRLSKSLLIELLKFSNSPNSEKNKLQHALPVMNLFNQNQNLNQNNNNNMNQNMNRGGAGNQNPYLNLNNNPPHNMNRQNI